MKRNLIVIIGVVITILFLSGCITKDVPQYYDYIIFGYLEDWDFYNDTDVGGFILIISNASWNTGFTTDEKEHWFSDIKYSPIEMDYFINHNVSILYETNYYPDWNEDYRYNTIVKEMKILN